MGTNIGCKLLFVCRRFLCFRPRPAAVRAGIRSDCRSCQPSLPRGGTPCDWFFQQPSRDLWRNDRPADISGDPGYQWVAEGQVSAFLRGFDLVLREFPEYRALHGRFAEVAATA